MKNLFAILLLLFSTMATWANETPTIPPDKTRIPINPKPIEKPTPRPHDEMPFVQEITCSIEGSVITIEFAEPEGTARVFLYDLSLPSNILPLGYQVSTTVPSMIPVPGKTGMYRLLITTSLGNEYEGYFDID